MRDVGEEVVLAPVGFQQPLVRLAQHARPLLDRALDDGGLLAHVLAHRRALESERGLQRERAEQPEVRLGTLLRRCDEDAECGVARSPERRRQQRRPQAEQIDQFLPHRVRRAPAPDRA